MQNITTTIQKWVLLSTFFAMFTARTAAQIDLGQVQVSTIGHRFDILLPQGASGPPFDPNMVLDLLIDQSQTSSGGALLPSVSANFDVNNQFVLTVSAPPGQRFLVRPPAGTPIYLGIWLGWQTPPPYSAIDYGTTAVSFGDLTGTLPAFNTSSSILSVQHDSFAFNNIYSQSLTGVLSFSSITLIASVPSSNTSRGELNYNPIADSNITFFYETYQGIDPGSFVSLVPEPSTDALLLLTASLGGVWIAFRRPRGKNKPNQDSPGQGCF